MTTLPISRTETEKAQLIESCDTYLANRTGNYRWRTIRYDAVTRKMLDSPHGLADTDIVVDWAAGGTELDVYLRQVFRWHGRYWPLDGWQGYDLRGHDLPREVDWIVSCEYIEHITPGYVQQFFEMAKRRARKGFVITTPNPDVVDVFAMDDTHVFAVREHFLRRHGLEVETAKLYGTDNDSLIGWWYAP